VNNPGLSRAGGPDPGAGRAGRGVQCRHV